MQLENTVQGLINTFYAMFSSARDLAQHNFSSKWAKYNKPELDCQMVQL